MPCLGSSGSNEEEDWVGLVIEREKHAIFGLARIIVNVNLTVKISKSLCGVRIKVKLCLLYLVIFN